MLNFQFLTSLSTNMCLQALAFLKINHLILQNISLFIHKLFPDIIIYFQTTLIFLLLGSLSLQISLFFFFFPLHLQM